MFIFEVNKRHDGRCENLYGLFMSLKCWWKWIFRIHDTSVYCRKSNNFFLEFLDGTGCYLFCLLEQLQIIISLAICYLSSDKDTKSRIVICCAYLPLLFSSQSPFICGFDALSSASLYWLIWLFVIVVDEDGPSQKWLSRQTWILWNLVVIFCSFSSSLLQVSGAVSTVASRYIAIYVNYIHHLKHSCRQRMLTSPGWMGMILNLLFELHFSMISESLSLACDLLIVACSFIFPILFIFIFCDSLLYSPYLCLNV